MASPDLTQKYDRQIRIWGDNGQSALQRASVCVINVGPTGTETLKNLVLAGIGSFTVVDGLKFSPGDSGNNFFIPYVSCLDGQERTHRAVTAAKSLLELNDEVDGFYIAEDPAQFLRDKSIASYFFRNFSLVVVTQLGIESPLLQIIADGCCQANVPLIVARAYGLIGHIRVQVPEMCILDARHEALPQDLRLISPFPALQAFVDAIDLGAISDSSVAAHVPFIVILIKALEKFRQKTGCVVPASRSEKDEFAVIVNSLRPPICAENAENFVEAMKHSNLRLCYADSLKIPEDVEKVLLDPRASCDWTSVPQRVMSSPSTALPIPVALSRRGHEICASENGASSPSKQHAADRLQDEIASFWLHAAGVRAFVTENDRKLPLAGSLPDMTADTRSYVTLQRIYAEKAQADVQEVLKHVSRIAANRMETCHFDESTVREFCRRLQGVRVQRFRSIHEELEDVGGSTLPEHILSDEACDTATSDSALAYYVVLRAAERFRTQVGAYPAERDGSVEEDLAILQSCLVSVKNEIRRNLVPTLWRDEAEELMRFSNIELHNVASFLGGAAAQEAVKVITRQFVPLNNTLVVNFANMTSSSFIA